MSERSSFRSLSLGIAVVLLLSLVVIPFTAPVSAQTAAPTQLATGTPSIADDADELPIYINVTGYVQEFSPTVLKVNGLTILIPTGMTIPGQIAVGKVVSLHGNLHDDDTIALITIVIGYHLPTSTPVPPTTPVATAATQQPTLQATEDATVPPTLPAVADCGKARQSLAVMISAAYRVTYNEVIRLHCQGYSFGTIARGFLLVYAGRDAGKDLAVETILILRLKKHRWSIIILMLGVRPDSTLLILLSDGGRAAVFFNCGSGATFNHAAICVGIGPGRGSGGGGGNAGGTGKGHKGDDDEEDD